MLKKKHSFYNLQPYNYKISNKRNFNIIYTRMCIILYCILLIIYVHEYLEIDHCTPIKIL